MLLNKCLNAPDGYIDIPQRRNKNQLSIKPECYINTKHIP